MTDLVQINPARDLALAQPITPERALGLWLSQFRSDNTKAAYRYEIVSFVKFMKGEDVGKTIEAFLALDDGAAHARMDAWRQDKLRDGKAPASINRSLTALSSFVKAARRYGATKLRLEVKGEASKPYRDTRGPGVAGVRKLIKAAHEQADPKKVCRDVAIIILMFGLGLRRGEIASLNIKHFDAEAGTLSIMGKGRGERETLTVPAEIGGILAAWLAVRGTDDPDAALFIGLSVPPKGDRITGKGIYHLIRDQLGKAAGIRARPHGLRHAAITEALDVFDGDFRKVREFSRHFDINTILRYDDNRTDHAGQVASAITAIVIK